MDGRYVATTYLRASILRTLLASYDRTSFTRGQREITWPSLARLPHVPSITERPQLLWHLKAANKMPHSSRNEVGVTKASKAERARRYLAGAAVAREDSDDELGLDDHPWVWLYEELQLANGIKSDGGSPGSDIISADESDNRASPRLSRKRKRVTTGLSRTQRIIGARMGSFECHLGDCVLLKAEGTNEAWVGIICEFTNDEEHGMAARFMWFSSEKEIRNKEKKRKDFMLV